MRLLVYAATPIVAGAAFWGFRAWRGQAPKRYAVNAVLGLMLLMYFATTAALGLFWVARQELPIFDPHYLFGYLTIGLVAAHVAVNAKPLAKYARQQAPRSLVHRETGEWTFPVRGTAWLVAACAFGGVCFYVGVGRGSMTVVTSEGLPLPLPSSPLGESASASPPPLLAPPVPAVDQLITAGKTTTSVATFYHWETIASQDTPVDWSRRPEPFKDYPGAQTIALSHEFAHHDVSTDGAVAAARRPVLALYPKTVPLGSLSAMLQMTNGLTGGARTKLKGLAPVLTRAAPSAGGLYPTLTYVVARNVEGLAPGIYHYDVKGHALQLVRAGAGHLGALSGVTSSPQLIRGASFALVFTTDYFRTSFKYGARSYRFGLLDAGHIAENALLAAEYEGLAGHLLGRFDDGKVNALLGLDSAREAALLVLPVGERDFEGGAVDAEWPFVSAPSDIANPDVPKLITLLHGRTMLARAAATANSPSLQVRAFPPMPALARRGAEPGLALPAPAATRDDLFATIARRRSARIWAPDGITLAQLSNVLQTSLGAAIPNGLDPSAEDHRALRQYVIALQVRGLDAGVYAYDPEGASLRMVKPGFYKSQIYTAGLMQDCVGDAAAVIVHTADVARLPYPDGSRGYRYANFDAGMAGERIYLASVAGGLGTTGVGSFDDRAVSDLIGASGRDELVLYLSAIGAVPATDQE